MIRFFNTWSGRIESFEPLEEGRVRLYTCGPTVYDTPHIGNYRAYVFEDLLKRFLTFMGYNVTHVMNITDVEDKIIKRARQMGVNLDEYTTPFIEGFHHDLQILNIRPADHYPRATRYIDRMASLVKRLLEKGFVYEKEGSYYFKIDKFEPYGRLSKLDMAGRKIGVRIDSDEYEKESVHDFAVWKAPKPGEFSWESDIGPGRPGWHIECSAMSMALLGETLDIHCGGVDNIFPHHENEIAQSEAATGKTFVRYWLHCQHLIRDGRKMSKSMGNTISLEQLIHDHAASPRVIRFLLLSTHYRKLLNFTLDGLAQARAAMDRLSNFMLELRTRRFPPGSSPGIPALIEETRERFIQGLSDDLNISASLSALFDMVRKSNGLMASDRLCEEDARELSSAVADLDRVLGVLEPESGGMVSKTTGDLNIKVEDNISVDDSASAGISDGKDGVIPDDVMSWAREREQAREAKDFARADVLRDKIRDRGYRVEDTRDGPRLKKNRGD